MMSVHIGQPFRTMDEKFAVYVDRLRSGGEEAIEESLSPDFLDIDEEEVSFRDPVEVRGKAYLAEGELVVDLDVSTNVEQPCIICGNPVKSAIHLPHCYITPEKSGYKNGIFNFRECLREEILLDLPHFIECHEGKCPERKELQKFIKKQGTESGKASTQNPFAEL